MTITITPEPHARPTSSPPLTSVAAAAEHIEDISLADSAVGTVGLELEAHCFDVDDPHRRPGWQEISDVIAALPPLTGGSAVTVEPGGAVELSGPPLPDAEKAIEALTADRATLRAEFAEAGLGLVLLGADPLRPPKRINPGARYGAMEEYFAATGNGRAGAAMMTSTASIQINIDAGPAAGWADRVRLAHALGPVMIAVAANSPLLSGEFSGWQSSRQRVWSQLDTARCGPVLGASGVDPASDWALYALRAPVMLVHDPEAVPVRARVPFADWVEGEVEFAGRRPTIADLDYHLTTLFPPVRPRRWLEIRYLDSVPDALWPAVVFTLVTLMDDRTAADVAAEATEPVATAWDVAARLGLADRRVHQAAVRCVSTAADLAPESVRPSMELLVALVDQGTSPGEALGDDVIRRGLAPAVVDLARGEG